MSDRRYYGKFITTRGRIELDRQIEEWKAKLAESLKVNGSRATRGCDSSSNGHPGTDSVAADHENMRRIITDLTLLRSQATRAEPPASREVLRVDMVATLMYKTEGSSRNGREVRSQIHVVGFNESDCDSVPRKVCYEAALVRPFLGREVGAQAHVYIEGKVRLVTMTGIYFLSDRRVKKPAVTDT
ncbi:MAG: hypothetical protein AAB921_00145 [Patescibacteria group bacterium]